MAKRFLTIMLIPDQGATFKRLVIPVRYIKGAVITAASIAALILFFTGGFFYYRHQSINNENLRLENQRYRTEIDAVRSKVASIETYLDRVKRFDQKLRIITNLEDPERHIALGPLDARETLEEGGRVSPPQTLEASLSPELRPPQFDVDEGESTLNHEDMGKMQGKLDELEVSAAQREKSLQTLENQLHDMGAILRATPAVWPSYGWVTSNFGFRISPFSGERTMHEGLDIAASPGTPVKSPADGIVTYVGTEGGYGKSVVINHGYGTVTRYGHLSEIYVRLGDTIKRGGKIAAIGNTGRSTGPHLHYEVVVNGIPRDPKKYILN